jgi:hypothetical protein
VRIARRAIGGVVKPEEEDDEPEETDVSEEDSVNNSEEIVSEGETEDTAALDRR